MNRQRRPIAWGGAGLALAFAVLCGGALLADGYSRHATELETNDLRNGRALASREVASGLTPWRPQSRQKYAWSLARRGFLPEAQQEITAALALNPADAYLWTEYAQMLAWQGRFGPELERAVGLAQRLAPAAAPVQRALAHMGLHHWHRATPALESLWLASMQFTLRRNPDEFLQVAAASNRMLDFCLLMAPALSPGPWCPEQTRPQP